MGRKRQARRMQEATANWACHKAFRNQQLKAQRSVQDWRTTLRELELSTRSCQKVKPPSPLSRRLSRLHIRAGPPDPLNPVAEQRRADEISRPTLWTKKSFTGYVEQLLRCGVSRSAHRFLYASDEDHTLRVCDILENLLMEDDKQQFLKLDIVSQVLVFFVKHHKLPQARRLFVDMDRHGGKLNEQAIHIMLRGAAKANDLHNFTFLLRLMLQRGLEPDASTWLAFLLLRLPVGAKTKIVQVMRRKGLIQSSATLQAATRFVAQEQFPLWLDAGLDPMAFIDCMQDIYGSSSLYWYTSASFNHMLDELGKRGLNAAILTLWDVSRVRGQAPSTVSLNIVLIHCGRSGDAELAIHMLQLAERDNIASDKVTYDALSQIAWKGLLYNFARVVWRCACVDGAVSMKLQTRLRKSLAHDGAPTTVRQIWIHTVGKIAFGVAEGPNPEAEAVASDANVLSQLCRPRRTAEERAQAANLIRILIWRDLGAFRTRRRSVSLAKLLQQAFRTDREWIDQGLWDSRSIEWKIERAIHVPFDWHTVRRVGGLGLRGNLGPRPPAPAD
ncbi:MAG: hypothetical protein M1817_003435 [Caeruleum heppii]|nr:MAG: hypothetical protein M1817_003435 [Caeruleum heppii]